MIDIPDAPYIREASQRGTDYVYEWVSGQTSARNDANNDAINESEDI